MKTLLNKHVLIIVVCAIVVFTLGALSNKAWNSQVVRQHAAAAKQATIAADAKRRQADAVADEKARLKAECDKETAYYNALTPAVKAKQAAPECTTIQVVQ